MTGLVHGFLRQNVLGLVAIFIALTGTAVALPGKNKVDSGDIENGQVRSADIGTGAVSSEEVADDALTGRDIDESSLSGLTGATGPTGPAGSPDTPSDILSKLSGVDGSGSGLDADLLDGLGAAALVQDADAATGDLTGSTFNDPQLAGGSVGSGEVANGALRLADTAVLTAESTIDLPPFSVCVEQNFLTDPAIEAGDIVEVAVPSNSFFADVSFHRSRTTTNDEARVSVCNVTNGSIVNVAPGTFTVTVFRP